MRKSHIFLLIVVPAVAVLIGWLWVQPPQHPARSSKSAGTDAARGDGKDENASIADVRSSGMHTPTLIKEDRTRAVLGLYNHREIQFFGKVIDQYGDPVSAVNVTGSVIYNNGDRSGVQEAHTTTDSQGLFSFTGMQGRSFDYHLQKSGYQTMPDGKGFDYTHLVSVEKRHHPDPKNPVILKMWKLEGAERLIHFEHKYFALPADGVPLQIDLLSGKLVTVGGDIVFALNHAVLPPGSLPEPQFNWRARIAVTGGGLLEADPRHMYRAPNAGYVLEIMVDMPIGSVDWTNTINRSFYVHTRGNLFARLDIYLNANQRGSDPSFIMLEWWVNPKAGSLNLEGAMRPK